MMDYIVHKRELLREERPIAELHNLAVALSRHQIDESESFVFADRATEQKAWEGYKAKAMPRDMAYTARQRYEWHVQAAVDCVTARAWDGALHHLGIALAQNPNSGMLHLLRAQAWQNIGDDAKALADLNRAAELEPRCRNIWETRGRLHVGLKKYTDATADFAKVIELGTDATPDWHLLALLYLTAGKTQEYRKLCAKMLDNLKPEGFLSPEDVLSTCALNPQTVDPARLFVIVAGMPRIDTGRIPRSPALAYHRAGKHAEAAAYLAAYLKQQQAVGEALTGAELAWAALIYRAAGWDDEAESWYQRALAWREKEGTAAAWLDRAECDLVLRELRSLRKSKA
jgi:tetratricopeptide (TPR) repeat protein